MPLHKVSDFLHISDRSFIMFLFLEVRNDGMIAIVSGQGERRRRRNKPWWKEDIRVDEVII